jgi:hypothetical protein
MLLAPLFDSRVDFKFLVDSITMLLTKGGIFNQKIVFLVAPFFETGVKIATKCDL